MTLWSFLETAAARAPAGVAVAQEGRHWTWQEFADRARRLADRLRASGVGVGERVAILEGNTHRHLEAYFAAAGAGAVLVPLNLRLTPGDLAFQLRDAGARCLLVGDALPGLASATLREGTPVRAVLHAGAAPEPEGPGIAVHPWEDSPAPDPQDFVPAEVSEDAVAQIYYTSGTTGRPKGVMLTHRNVGVHARNAVTELGLTGSDVWGHVAPLFHLADAWATFAITLAGGTHACLPRFDALAALDFFERHRVTISNLVPTMLNLMVRHPTAPGRDWSSLRRILSGGAPIAPALIRSIMQVFGAEYVQTYGMTETSPYLTLGLLPPRLQALPPDEQFPWRAKTGRPFLGIELRVVREDGALVASDGREVGEIQVRGETVTPGYWNRSEETAAAFAPGGWLRTGDLAVLDAEGFVDIVDRRKDVIITGGEKVYSTEVESVLYAHPSVLEAAVFARPDELWGEVVTAAIVLRPGSAAGADELVAWCRARLAGYKVPRRVEFLPELPKTGSGKISKQALRTRPEDPPGCRAGPSSP